MVDAVCRVCKKSSPAEDFVLDPEYKMMVCPECVKRRKREPLKPKAEEPKKIIEAKPAGWDADDEYLEKTYKKKYVRPNVKPGQKVKCRKCGYIFKYSPVNNTCPYCDAPI